MSAKTVAVFPAKGGKPAVPLLITDVGKADISGASGVGRAAKIAGRVDQ